MCKIILALLAAALPATVAIAAPTSDCLTDGRVLTLRGTIRNRHFTDVRLDGTGREYKHAYTALQFDRPRCVDTDFYGYETGVLEEAIVGPRGLELTGFAAGQRVAMKVKVEESGGTIHWPTSVSLTILTANTPSRLKPWATSCLGEFNKSRGWLRESQDVCKFNPADVAAILRICGETRCKITGTATSVPRTPGEPDLELGDIMLTNITSIRVATPEEMPGIESDR
jgi:hypothetical protein